MQAEQDLIRTKGVEAALLAADAVTAEQCLGSNVAQYFEDNRTVLGNTVKMMF